MHRIVLEAEAGQVSAELARLGVAATEQVRATVEVASEAPHSDLPRLVQEGGGFHWLQDEPDLYSDADIPTR